MEPDCNRLSEHILQFTLEIIYLLTGEENIVVNKPAGDGQDAIMVPLRSLLDPGRNNEEKILEITKKITDLLTGESGKLTNFKVRIKEERKEGEEKEQECVEGHRDLYKDVVMENESPLTSPDGSSKRNPPERCPRPLYSRDSTQEHHEIPQARPLYSRDSTQEDLTVPHHDQIGVSVDIKVEVKEEEEPSVMGEEPWKEEEVPSEISTDGQNSRNIAEDCLSLSRCKMKDIIETFAGDKAASRYLQSASIPHAPSTHGRHLPAQSRIITHHTSVSVVETRLHSTDSFPQKSSLNSGEASSPDQGWLTCSECGKGFLNQALFLAHCKSHSGEKPYACPYCGKGFAHKSDFNKHQRIHTGEKPFSCLECGKSFTQKSNHMRHQKVHLAEKPYSCSHCGKGFSQKSNFQRHIQSHSEEKSYSCRECGRHFALKAHLLQHQTVHRGQKPYCCTECGKHFAHQSSFYRHQKNHTGDKPYACRECGDRFTQSSSLARHQQRHLQLLH